MSRKPSTGPIQTSSSSSFYNPNLLTTPVAAGQQRVRSGSDVLPRSGASSLSATTTTSTPSFVATLASTTNHIHSGSGRTTLGPSTSASAGRRSTVTSSSSSSTSTVTPSDVTVGSAISTTPMPFTANTTLSTANRSAPVGTSASGGGLGGSEPAHMTGARSATTTPATLANQRSELRRNKRKEVTNYHIQLERVLGLTTTRPSALSMNKRMGLVAYAAGCVVVLYDYHRGTQVGSLACSSLTASWTYQPSSSDEDARPPGSVLQTPSASAGSASSQYWQPWMNHPMASPFVNPLAGLMPMSGGGGFAGLGGGGGGVQHASSDLLPPPGGGGGGGLLSSTSPSSNRKTDSESSSKVPASLKPKPISCLAFSPDGQYLAVGETGHQPRILVWDVIQRVPVVELIGHQFGVQALQFSANGKILVSLGFQHDGFVHVWNWRSRLKLATNKVTSKVNALIHHNADGSVTQAGATTLSFITVGLRHVKFWYLGQSKAHARAGIADIRLLDGRSAVLGEMRDANFVDAVSSPDGEHTYLITASGVLCMLNKDRTMDRFVDLQVRAGYSISMDGNCIVCACADGIIRLFEPATLKYHTTLPLPSPLGYSPMMEIDGSEGDSAHMYSDAAATLFDAETQRLFSVYGDRSIRTWTIGEDFHASLLRTHLNHSDCVWGIETVPTPKEEPTAENYSLKSEFMTFSADGTVRFWGTCSPSVETGERDGQEELSLLHVLYPDSQFLQWLAPPEVQAMDPAGASAPLESGIRVAKISPAGNLLATGDRGGNLRVHDLRTMTEITYQEAHENDILAIDFTNTTHQLLTAAIAPSDPMNGPGEGSYEGSEVGSSTTPFYVATAGRDRLLHVFDISDGRIYVYNLKSGKATKSIKADVPCIDGSLPTSSSTGSTSSLSQGSGSGSTTGAGSGMAGLATLPPSSSLGVVDNCSMTHLDLDPSGTIAIASGSDKSIRVYDLMQKLCLARMVCHSELITGVKLSSNFKHIYSTSGDGCTLVWRLSSALVKKIESRQQMAQEKQTLAVSHEQARRMSQQDDDDCEGTVLDEAETQYQQRRKNHRWRSLSQSAAAARSTPRRPSTNQNVLPPPLPPPRTLSPSPSAGKALRHSPSMDRQLNPYMYKDGLSASDLSSASRRNSEASILSDDANDSVSAEEVSSSDGTVYPERQQQRKLSAARPGTPHHQRVKSGYKPSQPRASSSSSKSNATEVNESAFQVSVASPESLMIHKRLSRTLVSTNSESSTPTGGRSRANSITASSLPSSFTTMSMSSSQSLPVNLAPLPSSSSSSTTKTPLRPSTPTQASQASSTPSSSLASRPAWGRAPLPAPKAVTPTKSTASTTTGSVPPTRRRQRTTSVISGRISFLAANNSINNTLTNAFSNDSQDCKDQDIEQGSATTASQQPPSLLQSQEGESDEMEDRLSDTATTTSDLDDSELSHALNAQRQAASEASVTAESEHDGCETPRFADGEDMSVNRDGAAATQMHYQRQHSQLGAGATTTTNTSAKPGRQSLTFRFLSANRPRLSEVFQPTGSAVDAEMDRSQGSEERIESPTTSARAVGGMATGLMTLDPPAQATAVLLEDRVDSSSQSRTGGSIKRAKLQEPVERGVHPPPFVGAEPAQRSPSCTMSTSGSFQALDVEEVDQPRVEGMSGSASAHTGHHHAGHVLASPAFVKSPVAGGLTSPVHLTIGGAGMSMMKDGRDSHRLQQALDSMGSLPSRDHHAMDVDEEEDSCNRIDGDDTHRHHHHHHDGSPSNRAEAIASLMDQLQMLLLDSSPAHSPPPLLHQPSSSGLERQSLLQPPLDRTTLEGTKDRLLQMVGCIQGQLWLMQADDSRSKAYVKDASQP
ncbi:Mitogen-activated protein kinase-binding protein 1 [Actinomortierella ambigua]|uniref:Mitogen-activated protein kinase-binding protein 1 n=1 Tax=Actinomortierella ambigua TaxID=1343610 RepID=A0A9P6Q9L1_9FUNG|nr:Mitogen-activated protein kinase-binding protein 1 [Actinomortierella ambigua]